MYLIVIAWLYVTVMMALAEASSPVGSVLGAVVTFVLYGLLPMAIVVYILGTPARKRRLRAQREAELAAWQAQQAALAAQRDASELLPDAGGHAAGAAEHAGVAPVREEGR